MGKFKHRALVGASPITKENKVMARTLFVTNPKMRKNSRKTFVASWSRKNQDKIPGDLQGFTSATELRRLASKGKRVGRTRAQRERDNANFAKLYAMAGGDSAYAAYVKSGPARRTAAKNMFAAAKSKKASGAKKAAPKSSGRAVALAGRARDSKGRLLPKSNPRRNPRRNPFGLSIPGTRELSPALMNAASLTVGAAAGAYVLQWSVPQAEALYGRIPWVGEYLVRYSSATTGILAGAALGILGYKIGGATGRYVGLLGGGVAAAGGALQLMQSGGDLAGLAIQANPYAGLAVQANPYAGIAVQANPGYAGVDLAGPDDQYVLVEYGDAMEGDADASGDDFDVDEGEHLIRGPRAWFQRFGRSPKVATRARGFRSRHAGRHGHRWGWLIKLVGFKGAGDIAKLPPAQRVQVIRDLKAQAMASLPNLMARASTGTTAPVATGELVDASMPMLQAANGVTGVSGATGYGALLFAGDGY